MKLSGLMYNAEKRTAHFDVSVPLTGGKYKRFRKTVKVLDKDDASAKFLIFRDNVLSGKAPEPTRTTDTTFAQFIDTNWEVIAADMKPNTAVHYRCNINARLIPVFGSLLFSLIDSNRIEDFRTSLRAKTHGESKKLYSASTVNDTMKLLHSILTKAKKRKLIAVVPDFPSRLREKKLMLELSEDEERAFLAAFDNREAFITDCHAKSQQGVNQAEVRYSWFRASKALFILALHTGLRRGDLLNLQWSSIDLKAMVLQLSTGKTDTRVYIPLSPVAVGALTECRNRRMSSTKWVFTQQDGNKYSLTTLRRHFAKAKQLAGLSRRFRFHDLRHTSGSKMASAGVPLQIIAKVLGHSTVSQSERYARPDAASLQQITAAMERK